MRLAPELVQNSLSYLNPLNERELDLRGSYTPLCDGKIQILHLDWLVYSDDFKDTKSPFSRTWA